MTVRAALDDRAFVARPGDGASPKRRCVYCSTVSGGVGAAGAGHSDGCDTRSNAARPSAAEVPTAGATSRGSLGDGRGADGVVRAFGAFFGIVASHSRDAVRWANRRIEAFRRAAGRRFMRFAEACLLAGDDVAEEIFDLAVKDISELDMRSGVGDGNDRYLRCLTSSCSY